MQIKSSMLKKGLLASFINDKPRNCPVFVLFGILATNIMLYNHWKYVKNDKVKLPTSGHNIFGGEVQNCEAEYAKLQLEKITMSKM